MPHSESQALKLKRGDNLLDPKLKVENDHKG